MCCLLLKSPVCCCQQPVVIFSFLCSMPATVMIFFFSFFLRHPKNFFPLVVFLCPCHCDRVSTLGTLKSLMTTARGLEATPIFVAVLFASRGVGVCSERHRAAVTSPLRTLLLCRLFSPLSCHSPLISIILPLSLVPPGICCLPTMFPSLSCSHSLVFFSLPVSPSLCVSFSHSVSSFLLLLSPPLVNRYEPKSHCMPAARENIFQSACLHTAHIVMQLVI